MQLQKVNEVNNYKNLNQMKNQVIILQNFRKGSRIHWTLGRSEEENVFLYNSFSAAPSHLLLSPLPPCVHACKRWPSCSP